MPAVDGADVPARAVEYRPYTKQQSELVPPYWAEKYDRDAHKYWDLFYRRNHDRFFKDRHYLHSEWSSELGGADAAAEEESDGQGDDDEQQAMIRDALGAGRTQQPEQQPPPAVLLEAGCGMGNTLFPLLRASPQLRAYAVDFSEVAVRHVASHPLAAAGRVTAAVCDLAGGSLPAGIAGCDADVATLMFVLSAIHPQRFVAALSAVATGLREGGLLLLRDYAEGDGAQQRLRSGGVAAWRSGGGDGGGGGGGGGGRSGAQAKQLDESGRFFVRQDGTRAYYFEPAQVTARDVRRQAGSSRRQVT